MTAARAQQLGKYEIVRSIGRGGMAEVFLARLPGADDQHREVVIKRVLESCASDEAFIAMFRDEARITAQLRHGNIVQVLEFGHADSGYFLALEYVDGPTLATVMRVARASAQPLPHAVVAYVLVEVARALDYAHRKRGADGAPLGVIHRDVSPSNILISRDGEVKLADFGIARAAARLTTTATGAIKGKVNYMAPEALDGKPEARSDLFALGAMAFEMIGGEPPFRGDSMAHALFRMLTQKPPALSSFDPAVPKALDDVVGRLLLRDPAERPARGDEVVSALTPVVLAAGRPGAELLAEVVQSLEVPLADPVATRVLSGKRRRPRAVIVERSPTARAALRAALGEIVDVLEVDDAEAAFGHAEAQNCELIASQQLLAAGGTGIDLCRRVRAHEHGARVRFVLLVGTVSAELRADAEAAGVDVVVEKADLDEVVRSVRRVLGIGG